MAQVKDWILTKCREAPTVLHHDNSSPVLSSLSKVVMTPDNIPAFTIPATRQSNDHLEDLQDLSLSSSSSSLTSELLTPQQTVVASVLNPQHPCYAKSAPVSPSPTWNCHNAVSNDSASYNDIDKFKDTNVDPQSIRAMRLPHFKTKTSFGFDTLAERPHTRRKESLFFDDIPLSRLNKQSSKSLQNCVPLPPPLHSIESGVKQRRDVPSMVAPLGVLTSHQCTLDTSLGCSNSPESRHRACCTHYTARRRSSYSNDGTHTDEDDDEDNTSPPSPIITQRRNSGSSILLNKSNLSRLMCKLRREEQHQRSCSLDCPRAPLGEIKLSTQFIPESRQLVLILLKADNLDMDVTQTSFVVKVYLSPGKIQKQCTSLIKNTLQINERFFFKNLDFQQLRRMSLHIKVSCKDGALSKRDIGQTQVIFSNIMFLAAENRMWKQLEPSSRSAQVTHTCLITI